MRSNLLIDLLHVQALCPGVEFCQRPLVCCVFTVEVVLLGADEALGAAAGVCGPTDCAGPGGGGLVGAALSIKRLVVRAADAVVCTWRMRGESTLWAAVSEDGLDGLTTDDRLSPRSSLTQEVGVFEDVQLVV